VYLRTVIVLDKISKEEKQSRHKRTVKAVKNTFETKICRPRL